MCLLALVWRRHCPNVVELYLRDSKGLSSEGLVAVAGRCKRLQRILLAHCGLVDDSGLLQLARGCPLLEVVDISFCARITDVAVLEVSRLCRMLRCTSGSWPACQCGCFFSLQGSFLVRVAVFPDFNSAYCELVTPGALATVQQQVRASRWLWRTVLVDAHFGCPLFSAPGVRRAEFAALLCRSNLRRV